MRAEGAIQPVDREPATATTTAANSGIHRRLSRPPSKTRCIRGSFDERQYVHRRYDTSSADVDQATAAQPAVPSKRDPHREVAGACSLNLFRTSPFRYRERVHVTNVIGLRHRWHGRIVESLDRVAAATVIAPVEVTRLATIEGISPAAPLPGAIHIININAKLRMARIAQATRLSRDRRTRSPATSIPDGDQTERRST
jgi:hypothetical protein